MLADVPAAWLRGAEIAVVGRLRSPSPSPELSCLLELVWEVSVMVETIAGSDEPT